MRGEKRHTERRKEMDEVGGIVVSARQSREDFLSITNRNCEYPSCL